MTENASLSFGLNGVPLDGYSALARMVRGSMCRSPISPAHWAATISRIKRYVSVTAHIPANSAILIPFAQIPPKKIQYAILIFLAGIGVHVEVASAGNNP